MSKKSAARDENYFRSEEFLELLRSAAKEAVTSTREASEGRLKTARGTLRPAFDARPKDMPDIQAAFAIVKGEYPELDHVRRNRGVGATIGRLLVLRQFSLCSTRKDIVVDTKKNTLFRSVAQGAAPVWPFDGSRREDYLPSKSACDCPRLKSVLAYK